MNPSGVSILVGEEACSWKIGFYEFQEACHQPHPSTRQGVICPVLSLTCTGNRFDEKDLEQRQSASQSSCASIRNLSAADEARVRESASIN